MKHQSLTAEYTHPGLSGQPGNLAHDDVSSPGRFIWHYIRARSFEFIALLICVMSAAVCAVVMQYQLKRLVDAMAIAAHSPRMIWSTLGVFIALMAIESALLRLSGWLACRSTIAVGVQMRLDLFNYLAGHSVRYFAENLTGSLGQRITGTAGSFGALANTTAWRIAPPIVDYVGALVIFRLIDWPMAAVLGTVVAAATAVLLLAGRKGRHLHSVYFGLGSRVAGNIVDVISNMWVVKAFNARQREARRLQIAFREEAAAQQSSWMYTEKTRIVYDLALWVAASAMSFWAVRTWSRGAITPGDVVVVMALTFRILHGSRDVALALVDVSLQVGYIDDTLRSIGSVHTIVDSPFALNTVVGPGKIAFKNVTFGYDPNKPVLRHVNIVITPGEKVGIVGASGAGKSTILQLIQRLHVPQSGEITIDGISIQTHTQDALRAVLAVVPQEISLFHRSIMDNIRFGRPEATDDEIYRAARAAECEEFVLQLPDGYATWVGERGVKLSGGQRQRIGIARALLKNARILILDEATSGLDTASELEVQKNVTRWHRDSTVIAVAHRLSTLASYDRILVVDDGRIIEDGRPSELRTRGKLFRSMWRLQSNGLSIEEDQFAEVECGPKAHDHRSRKCAAAGKQAL
jgi:ATP-binding cassette subfamily B protein